jgi:hypothetical protein
MMTLRWTLGLVTTVVAIGWVALAIAGSGFRRSFGASGNPAWLIVIPVVVGLLVVASVVWPERRALLHVAALCMASLGVGCVFLARETVFVAALGVCYALTWFAFYYRAAWASVH